MRDVLAGLGFERVPVDGPPSTFPSDADTSLTPLFRRGTTQL